MKRIFYCIIIQVIVSGLLGGSAINARAIHRADTTELISLFPATVVVADTIYPATAIVTDSISEDDTVATDTLHEVKFMSPYRTEDGEFNRLFRLKTNAAGWLLLIANVEGEIDLSPGWSFTLPIYYGAMDYFTPTVKFRMFGFRPEVRRWFRDDNTGWFAGLHFGIGGFNFALGGEYRYQSDWRKKPAVGGGLSGGYRLPISSDRRWELELAIGIGVYSAPYNRFKNEKNARPIDSVNKIYFGPDNIAITFSYAFDVKSQKGGKK